MAHAAGTGGLVIHESDLESIRIPGYTPTAYNNCERPNTWPSASKPSPFHHEERSPTITFPFPNPGPQASFLRCKQESRDRGWLPWRTSKKRRRPRGDGQMPSRFSTAEGYFQRQEMSGEPRRSRPKGSRPTCHTSWESSPTEQHLGLPGEGVSHLQTMLYGDWINSQHQFITYSIRPSQKTKFLSVREAHDSRQRSPDPQSRESSSAVSTLVIQFSSPSPPSPPAISRSKPPHHAPHLSQSVRRKQATPASKCRGPYSHRAHPSPRSS